MKQAVHELVPLLQSRQVILIGENHGVQENALFVRNLLEELLAEGENILFVGLEYPTQISQELHSFVEENNYEGFLQTYWGKMLLDDGRFSSAHFKLLRFLYECKMEVLFFDDSQAIWDERDKKMAQTILTKLENKAGKVILVAGNIHTKLEPFPLEGKSYKPLGAYLDSEKLFQITLKYHAGEYFNFARRLFTPTVFEKPFQQTGPNSFKFSLAKATATQ